MSERRNPGPDDSVDSPEVDGGAAFPTNAVVGIVEDPRELSRVVEELRASGYRPDVLCGERGIARIEQPGGLSRRDVRMIRSVQRLFGFEAEHAERHQRAVENGDFLVIVGADDADAERLGQIFADHGGRFVNYYTRWTGRPLVS